MIGAPEPVVENLLGWHGYAIGISWIREYEKFAPAWLMKSVGAKIDSHLLKVVQSTVKMFHPLYLPLPSIFPRSAFLARTKLFSAIGLIFSPPSF